MSIYQVTRALSPSDCCLCSTGELTRIETKTIIQLNSPQMLTPIPGEGDECSTVELQRNSVRGYSVVVSECESSEFWVVQVVLLSVGV